MKKRQTLLTVVMGAAALHAETPVVISNTLFEAIVSTEPARRESAETTFETLDPGLQSLLGAALLNACAQGPSADCPRVPGDFLSEWMGRLAREGAQGLQGSSAADKAQALRSLSTVAKMLSEADLSGSPGAQQMLDTYKGPSFEALLKLIAKETGSSDPAVRAASAATLEQLSLLLGEGAAPTLEKLSQGLSPEARNEVTRLLKELESMPLDELQSNTKR